MENKTVYFAEEESELDRRRRHKYVASGAESLHPGTRAAILEGQVILGMTKEQVQASLGEPKTARLSVSSKGHFQSWIYRNGGGRTTLEFQDDKVSRIEGRDTGSPIT